MTPAPKRQPIPFGAYLLLDRVHIGGLSELWRAKTFATGGLERLVVIKRLLPNLAGDEALVRLFVHKAMWGVLVSHANVVQVYELGKLANSSFMAVEYVSGRDLGAVFERCRKRGEPAPVPLVCYAIAQCCEGLDAAHRARDTHGRALNLVHREVSLPHLLVSYDGEVKVTDFGGAPQAAVGYLSPEQLSGAPVDHRSDVFAVGVCLYELLTGERLFASDAARRTQVAPPSHFNPKIPAPLDRIVLKALSRDVNARYQHARELADDLRAFMSFSNTVVARPELSRFMKSLLAEDYERERQRLQEYAGVKPPSGVVDLLN